MKHLLLTVSGIALCMRQIRCQLLSLPINTICNSGQRVEFECSTNLSTPLRWEFAPVNSTRFEFIYFNEELTSHFSSRYKVHTPRDGHSNLVIDSADVSHAGTYRCLSTPNYYIGEKETSASAELIVIDSHPRCSTNASEAGVVEGDSLRMWCTFNYNGNWIPVMDVIRNSKGTVGTKIDYSYEPFKVTVSLVTQLSSSDNGATFMCRLSLNRNITYSEPAKEGEMKANNDPHYQHLWNYTANVLYGPRNLTIMLIDKALKVGSRLVCHADGNPAPNYGWELVGKHRPLTNGSVIVIKKSMVSDEEQTLRCTATNVLAGGIRNSTTTFFTFNLTDLTYPLPSNDPELNPYLILGISVGVGLLILCLVIVAITYKMRTKGLPVQTVPTTAVSPIYAVVQKQRNGDAANEVAMPANHHHTQQKIPVYTEVKKHVNDQKKTGTAFRISIPTERTPKQNYAETDGIEYAEMNVLTGDKVNVAPAKHPQLFSLVETYASVDHTAECPPTTPPPLPKRN